MVWALTRRKLVIAVTRPDELWHLDMTSIWVAGHSWCLVSAAIDCCTREIVCFSLEMRRRAVEACEPIEEMDSARGDHPGQLVLGTDSGSAYTPRRTRMVLSGLGIARHRGGYRDLESQAFTRALDSLSEEALHLVLRVRDPRPGLIGDRRLRRELPPNGPLGP
jgi:transposase InsO family protein